MYRWFFVPMLLIGSITLATSPYPLAAQTQDPFQSAPGPVPEPAKPATQGRSSSHPRERVTIERVLVPTPVPTEPVRPLSVPISPIPAPQPSPAGPLDGTYRGTVTAVATITAGHGRHGGGHHENCQAGRPVQMNISGGAVTIHQAMVDGRAVGYQGGVDAAGNVNASHTGFDGVVFSAVGTVSSRFAGQLRRRGCVFTIELTKVSGTPG